MHIMNTYYVIATHRQLIEVEETKLSNELIYLVASSEAKIGLIYNHDATISID